MRKFGENKGVIFGSSNDCLIAVDIIPNWNVIEKSSRGGKPSEA